MFIIRAPKNSANPFTQVSNNIINDNRLTLKSKALLFYFLSRPPSWCFNFRDILLSNNVGIKSVRSSIRELISIGYIFPFQSHRPNGDFDYFNYTVYETPVKISSIKTTIPAHDPFGNALEGCTLEANTLLSTPLNNKIKIKFKKETTSTPTKVVISKAAVVSSDYPEKKQECITLCNALNIMCPDSLIKKYGLDRVFKNVKDFNGFISTAKNPTGCLVSSIKDNWIPSILKNDEPKPRVIFQDCSVCLKYFSYLGFKRTHTVCQKCKNKGK